ncbi:hypothetical protein ABPG77_006634 [Micractinium sp. CCAP 211/92]
MGMAGLAAGGLPPLAAGALSPRGGRGGGGVSGPLPGEFGDPARRATDVLLVGNALLFGLQLLSKELVTVWGIKINALIVAGQWWRLLTPAFLHGNLMHLVVNSYSLNNLGPTVERTAGSGRFLLMYLAAAVAGNVASFYGSAAPSLGASGAIFGIGGALAMYFYRNKDIHGRRSEIVLRSLWQTLLMNILYGLSNPRIDNWGHMGGMAGGALAALLLGPRWKVVRLPGKRGNWLVDDAPLPWFRSQPRPAA